MYDLEKLKNGISIIDYGQNVYGYTPEKKRTNYWGFKEFDSLMVNIDKNCFFRNSEYKQGSKSSSCNHSAGSILDFIMHVENCSLDEAIKKLKEYNDKNGVVDKNYQVRKYVTKPKKFVIPIKANTNKHAFGYLVKERKITPVVFNSMVKRKYLYEEVGYYRNAIFCSYIDKKMVFAQRCSCRQDIDRDKRKRDVSGSSYEECFFVDNKASSLIVTEATIDTLSFMSLLEINGIRFNNYNHLGLTGTNKAAAVLNILDKYPHITTLFTAFDNDEAGKDAFDFVLTNLRNKMHWTGKIINVGSTYDDLNDINDILKKYVENDDEDIMKEIQEYFKMIKCTFRR